MDWRKIYTKLLTRNWWED